MLACNKFLLENFPSKYELKVGEPNSADQLLFLLITCSFLNSASFIILLLHIQSSI